MKRPYYVYPQRTTSGINYQVHSVHDCRIHFKSEIWEEAHKEAERLNDELEAKLAYAMYI